MGVLRREDLQHVICLGSVGTCLCFWLEGFGSPWCEAVIIVAFQFEELGEMRLAVQDTVECCIIAKTVDWKKKEGSENRD